ncbi:MAG: PLP-dependent aminotransferase family protein [Anaerovoracaceae bacterium]|jgi:GntR family transcriptional regulator/MocR family aminotransferase
MISLTPILNDALGTPLYMQLYEHIKNAILEGHILPGEKLPSLRSLSKTLNLSLSTISSAYDQLTVEGYITSLPQSGYYVNSIPSSPILPGTRASLGESADFHQSTNPPVQVTPYYDPECFDFTKWKKCMNRILNYESHTLFLEGDIRGEEPLRHEISKYIYQVRGVLCSPDQIIISAGTQQLINLLCIILRRMEIDHVSFEDPGYQAVQSIFKDRGFKSTGVPVDRDGIQIEKLPINIRSTVYVSPSNQFPTGSVMPIGRRYSLLEWADKNESIIIEDDYNSELRYFSRPVPSLQGLDRKGRVVYLGSFSSTLFPAIKISYMVLPTAAMGRLFYEALGDYTQTCSKTEQLTLALYMAQGFYQTDLKRLRKLYGHKIQLATQTIQQMGQGVFQVQGEVSGLHMMLTVDGCGLEDRCKEAQDLGLPVYTVPQALGNPPSSGSVLFYYTRIPSEKMSEAISKLVSVFQKKKADT